MPTLSTHVLDMSRGRPAVNVFVELSADPGPERRLLVQAATDGDGRVAREILSAVELPPGTYELAFHAGEYFASMGVELANPPFLDIVTVRFGLSGGHYHVPLLLSPYGYSTYRGS